MSTPRIDLDNWFGTDVCPWNPRAEAPRTWNLGAHAPVDGRCGDDFSGAIDSRWHTPRDRTDR